MSVVSREYVEVHEQVEDRRQELGISVLFISRSSWSIYCGVYCVVWSLCIGNNSTQRRPRVSETRSTLSSACRRSMAALL